MGIFDGVAGALQGESINANAIGVGLAKSTAFFGKLVFYFGMVFMIGFFVYYFLFRFNIRILIKKYGAGGKLIDIKKDFARIVKDRQGKTKLSTFKTRKTTPLPELKYRQKVGKYDYYEFIEDDNGELYPIETEFGFVGFKKKVIKEKEMTPELKAEIMEIKQDYTKAIKETKDKNEKRELLNEMQKIVGEAMREEVDVDVLEAKMRAIPQQRIAWLLQESQIIEDKLKKKDENWERIKFLAPYFGLIIMFLIAFFGFQYLSQGMSSVASALSSVANNCLGK